MKKNFIFKMFFLIMSLATLSYVTVGCSDVDTEDSSTPSLSVESASFSYDAQEQECSIKITANRDWKAESADSWLTITNSTGSNSGTLYFSISEAEYNRSTTITVSLYNSYSTLTSTKITVTQIGASGSSTSALIYIDGDSVPTSYDTSATTYTFNEYDFSLINIGNFSGSYDDIDAPIQFKSAAGTLYNESAIVDLSSIVIDLAGKTTESTVSNNFTVYSGASAGATDNKIEPVTNGTKATYMVTTSGDEYFTITNEVDYTAYANTIEVFTGEDFSGENIPTANQESVARLTIGSGYIADMPSSSVDSDTEVNFEGASFIFNKAYWSSYGFNVEYDGFIYNVTPLDGLSKVVIYEEYTYYNVVLYAGTSQNPTSEVITPTKVGYDYIYTIPEGYEYISITSNSESYTAQGDYIYIDFTTFEGMPEDGLTGSNTTSDGSFQITAASGDLSNYSSSSTFTDEIELVNGDDTAKFFGSGLYTYYDYLSMATDGYIYNLNPFIGLSKIVVSYSTDAYCELYEGSEVNPTSTAAAYTASGNVVTYTITEGNEFFTLLRETTSYVNIVSISIYYESVGDEVSAPATFTGLSSASYTFEASEYTPLVVTLEGDNMENITKVEFNNSNDTNFSIDYTEGNQTFTVTPTGENTSDAKYTATISVTVDEKTTYDIVVAQVGSSMSAADAETIDATDFVTDSTATTIIGTKGENVDVDFTSYTLSFAGSGTTAATYYYTSEVPNLRLYNGDVMTVASKDDSKVINSITITMTGSSYAAISSADCGTLTLDGAVYTWSGTATSVSFTYSGTSRISSIDINGSEEKEEETPEVDDSNVLAVITDELFTSDSYTTGTFSVGDYEFSCTDVGNYGSGVQVKKSTGTLYNTTPISGLEVLVFDITKTTYDVITNNFTVYAGTTENPLTTTVECNSKDASSSTFIYLIPEGSEYVTITATSSNAAYANSISFYTTAGAEADGYDLSNDSTGDNQDDTTPETPEVEVADLSITSASGSLSNYTSYSNSYVGTMDFEGASFYLNGAYLYNSYVSLASNGSYLYNLTAFEGLEKVVVTYQNANILTIYEGTDVNPAESSITPTSEDYVYTYNVTSGSKYITLVRETSSYVNIVSIDFYYESLGETTEYVAPALFSGLSSTSYTFAFDETIAQNVTINGDYLENATSISVVNSNETNFDVVYDEANYSFTIAPKSSNTSGADYSATITVTVDNTTKTMAVKQVYEGSVAAATTTWTLTPDDIDLLDSSQSSSYAKYNGSHTFSSIGYETYQIMPSSSMIQGQKSTGYLYNTTAMTNISKIEIVINSSKTCSPIVYVGTSENPTTGTVISGTDGIYDIPSGYDYFLIEVGSSYTLYADYISVTFESSLE